MEAPRGRLAKLRRRPPLLAAVATAATFYVAGGQQDAYAAAVQVKAKTWQARSLEEYPLAVCNDGSPGAYYYRNAGVDVRQWFVFLEGAGWCWDETSCAVPFHAKLGTSTEFPRTPEAVATWARNLNGVFDPERGPFKDLNIAYVRTCSNDAFMGNRGPKMAGSPEPGLAWHFRGLRIVEAVFEDLRKERGLGGRVGDRVIFGGCSSGARGALVTLEHVSGMTGLAQVVGLLDSGIWLPVQPLNEKLETFVDQTRKFLDFAEVPDSLLGSECVETYSGHQKWKCIMGALRLPFVKIPFFVTHSQYDLWTISMSVFGHFRPGVKLGAREREWAEFYRGQLIKYLPTPVRGSGRFIFSSAWYIHCTIASHFFYTIQADGVFLHEALARWLTATSADAATGLVIERCRGFNCGKLQALAPPTPRPTAVPTPFPTPEPTEREVPAWSDPALDTPSPSPDTSSGVISVDGTPWEARFLEDYPLAICNDGSLAAYYYRPGLAGARQWIVFLEGHGWCWDESSCNADENIRLGSSLVFPRSTQAVAQWASKLQGIFYDSGESPLKDWHIAYVRSCSNDAFLGDSSPEEAQTAQPRSPGAGWHFRGRRIMEATFNDLRRRTGLGAADGDLVLYGGSGSGARGALITLDYVAARLSGNADVVGLLDSPLWVPIEPKEPGLVSFDEQAKQFYSSRNTLWSLTKECEMAYPNEAWKCLHPAYRLPFVHTPYFMSQPLYDVYGISFNVFGRYLPGEWRLNSIEKAWAEEYRREVVQYLPRPTGESGNTVFAPACYVHALFADPVFYTIAADGVLLVEAVRNWLTAVSAEAATKMYVDHCIGFNCGTMTNSEDREQAAGTPMNLQRRQQRRLLAEAINGTVPLCCGMVGAEADEQRSNLLV